MHKHLDTRIAELEIQAGIGSASPTPIVVATFGVNDEELQHAWTDREKDRVQIHREQGESPEAFMLRARQLGRVERHNAAIVWVTD